MGGSGLGLGELDKFGNRCYRAIFCVVCVDIHASRFVLSGLSFS